MELHRALFSFVLKFLVIEWVIFGHRCVIDSLISDILALYGWLTDCQMFLELWVLVPVGILDPRFQCKSFD